MPTITSAGVGSGLDLENLISEVTRLEREPKEARLAFREAEIQAEISAFGALQSAMNDFRTALNGISTLSQLSTRTLSSSSATHFTGTATASAVPGTHTLEVLSTASAHRLVSRGYATDTTPVGNGTLTISVGGDSFAVSIVDAENDTIFEIRDAINNAPNNTGVTASTLYVDNGMGAYEYRLVLQADASGAENAITVTVSGDDDGNNADNAGLSALVYDPGNTISHLTELQAATDAQIRVDSFLVTQSSNTFTNTISGVTINVLEADPGEIHTLAIATDTSSVIESLQAFVDSYNQLNSTIDGLTNYDSENQSGSILTGDATVRNVESTLRRAMTYVLEGAPTSMNSLSALGITTGDDGVLIFSASKVSQALNTNFDQVAQLFAGEGGIAERVNNTLSAYINSDGIFASKRATYREQLLQINEARAALAFRVESIETRLRRQFSSLDILISSLNQTGSFVQEQLELTSAVLKREKS